MDDQRTDREVGGVRFSLKQLLKAVTAVCIFLALIVWVASRVTGWDIALAFYIAVFVIGIPLVLLAPAVLLIFILEIMLKRNSKK